jgi:Glycosyltransferase
MRAILSPVASGNGAFVVHKNLESRINGYSVTAYNPYRTLFPPSLYSAGRSNRADLIHTTPDYACFHYKENVPMILTFHGFTLDRYLEKYSSFLQNIHCRTDLRWFTQRSIRLANQITAVSHFTAQLVERELQPSKSIKVIYNGIDERNFTPARDKKSRDRIKVLFSGNLTTRKGAHWLLPIVERLNPNIDIYYTSGLRGKGSLLDHPRLFNVGLVEYAQMPSLYQSMDLLLFPTVREGFGLAAAEAMGCALPVVASNCSALPELIDSGKGGFLCKVGDVDDFAEKN